MSDFRRKLYAASAAYILGLGPKVKLRGTPRKTRAYVSVLEASKKLYEALEKEEGIESVDKLLAEKKNKAINFSHTTGLIWPF